MSGIIGDIFGGTDRLIVGYTPAPIIMHAVVNE